MVNSLCVENRLYVHKYIYIYTFVLDVSANMYRIWFYENEFTHFLRAVSFFHRSVQGDSHPIFRVRFEGLSGDKLSLDFPCLVAQVMRVPPRFRVDPNLPSSKGHTTLFPQGWRIYGRGGVRPRGRKMRRHCLRWKFCAMGVVRHGSPRVFTTIGSEISRCEWGQVSGRSVHRMSSDVPSRTVRNRRKFFAPRFANLPAGMRIEKVYSPFSLSKVIFF